MANVTKQLITKWGMQVEEIAFRIGASAQSVWNWKAGRTKPARHFARQLETMLKKKQAN